ncbi:MAG: hypothetical protein KGL39_33100 [Patescibacteria group bacterium]|nr:hypothetical protein [Patescibacteria group bacterium]
MPPRIIGHHDDEQRVNILNKPVSRLEMTQAMAPFANATQQHEGLLSFIMERGLKVTMEPDGLRARIDMEELKQWAAERNMLPKQPEPEPKPS